MPKLAAAIITGTMARPSRPSVRFTALPAPTMMKAPNSTKNQPKFSTMSLKNGITSAGEKGSRPSPPQSVGRGERTPRLDQQPEAAGEAARGLLCHFQVVVVEADKAE